MKEKNAIMDNAELVIPIKHIKYKRTLTTEYGSFCKTYGATELSNKYAMTVCPNRIVCEEIWLSVLK